jgi:threonylcarbamoyladenosine tRNA methylthiotransferase MtaB
LEDFDFIVPHEVKNDLLTLLENKMNGTEEKLPSELKAVRENRQSQFKSSVVVFDEAMSDQTRAYLKVQDGCDGFCAYCQIPYARGASRSVAPQQVLQEVRRLITQGVPEIVVTGIHVGDYGRDLTQAEDNTPFVELMQSILAEKGMKQVRISSLEPSEVSEPLLKVLKDHGTQFCDHFHLPLQSGSDRILKLMRRTYTTSQYEETVSMIRSYFPDVHVSGDVIVGFPQEGEMEFEESKAFISRLNLGSLHVFPYSKRPNTLAEKLPGHVKIEDIKSRVRILRELSSNLYRTYASQFLNRTMSVLWEKQTDSQGRVMGKTRNYLSVCSTRGQSPQAGTISSVTLKGFVDEKTLLGV